MSFVTCNLCSVGPPASPFVSVEVRGVSLVRSPPGAFGINMLTRALEQSKEARCAGLISICVRPVVAQESYLLAGIQETRS